MLHDPKHERLARGIINNSFDSQGDDLSADRQRESLKILAEFAQVSVRKTGAARIEPFTQVLISRTLTVRGEVAEWLKAAVC